MLWHKEEFMVVSMTGRCPGPVTAKQAETISPPPPCFDGWYKVIVLCLGFVKCVLVLYGNAISTLLFSFQRTLFTCNFAYLGYTAVFFLERSRLATIENQSFFFCTVMNFKI